jgi:signal transduction histidine kinase
MVNMSLKRAIRNVVIGNDKFIESYSEYRQVLLSGEFAVVGVLFCIISGVFNFYIGYTEALAVLATTAVFFIVTLLLHRRGNYSVANYVLLATLNISVYVLASSESAKTGSFLFFIVSSIASFAVFSYHERLLSILFAVFTYVLFALAYFIDFSILPQRNYSDDVLLFSIVINFSAALPATVMTVYLLKSLNHHNALELVQNNMLLSKTNAELDRFVYSTSHDLRAPLSSIMGLINITLNNQNPNEVRRYLSLMKDRVHSLDHFIKDITDYSRNNRLEVKREPVKLKDLAQEVWESLKFSPDAENIDFRIDLSDDVYIESDKSRLRVIISNLISNAVRYHDLKKDTQYIRLNYHMKGRICYIQVEDNGQGIASEYHARIFDMFFRANEGSKGTGLGLYIVKEALVKLSGSIKLESTIGVGTTFTIMLPHRKLRHS